MCQHSAQRLGRHLRQHPPEHLQISHALQRCNGRGRALRVRAILRRWSQRRSHHGRDASRALRRQGKSARVSTKARADPREPRQQGALDLALTHPPIHSQPNVPNFLQSLQLWISFVVLLSPRYKILLYAAAIQLPLKPLVALVVNFPLSLVSVFI